MNRSKLSSRCPFVNKLYSPTFRNSLNTFRRLKLTNMNSLLSKDKLMNVFGFRIVCTLCDPRPGCSHYKHLNRLSRYGSEGNWMKRTIKYLVQVIADFGVG